MQVFTPLQELQQAETVRGPIAPRTAVSGALRDVADGFLPVEALVNGVAFEIIAAREAQKRGLHVRE